MLTTRSRYSTADAAGAPASSAARPASTASATLRPCPMACLLWQYTNRGRVARAAHRRTRAALSAPVPRKARGGPRGKEWDGRKQARKRLLISAATFGSRAVPLSHQPLPSLLEGEHGGREGGQDGPLGERERRQTEDVPQRGDEHEGEQEGQLGRDSQPDMRIAEQTGTEDGLAVGAAGEDIPHLGGDDGREGHRGGAAVERTRGRHGQARPPARQPVCPEEGGERQRRPCLPPGG